MRSRQLGPMTPSVVSMLPSWLWVFSELVSSMPGDILVDCARTSSQLGFTVVAFGKLKLGS